MSFFNENSIRRYNPSIIRSKITNIAAKQINGFIYSSNTTAKLIDDTLNIAKYDYNVIIQGETGVGREKVFELIHHHVSAWSLHPAIIMYLRIVIRRCSVSLNTLITVKVKLTKTES